MIDPNFRDALELIQAAQGLIGEAAGKLSATPGYDDEPHARLCRLYDAVKAEWHHVSNHRHRLENSGGRSGRKS
jgi:hypothetical protein